MHSELLDRATVENALATTLLAESVAYLGTLGIPEPRLLKKLRDDRELWSTYAEIRAAKLLAAPFGADAAFELEPKRGNGQHADFKLRVFYEQAPVFVEFKAIGLSEEETNFSRRMGPQLAGLLPPFGHCTFHGKLDSEPFVVRPEARAQVDASAAECAGRVPNFPPGLASVAVVAHNAEPGYLRRLILRLVNEAAKQIPEGERGWAAFFWTNGISVRHVLDELRWEEVPKHVAGIIFVGDVVAFPSPNVHSYYLPVPRGMPKDARSDLFSNLSSDCCHRSERSPLSSRPLPAFVHSWWPIEVMQEQGSSAAATVRGASPRSSSLWIAIAGTSKRDDTPRSIRTPPTRETCSHGNSSPRNATRHSAPRIPAPSLPPHRNHLFKPHPQRVFPVIFPVR